MRGVLFGYESGHDPTEVETTANGSSRLSARIAYHSKSSPSAEKSYAAQLLTVFLEEPKAAPDSTLLSIFWSNSRTSPNWEFIGAFSWCGTDQVLPVSEAHLAPDFLQDVVDKLVPKPAEDAQDGRTDTTTYTGAFPRLGPQPSHVQ
jgi:hypothetical protein